MTDVERRKKDLDGAIDDYREAIVDEARGDATQEAQEDEAIDAAERWTV